MSEQNPGDQPPRPRYGEYAPPGWTAPAQPQQPAPAAAPPAQQTPPPAAPGWGGAPSQPAAPHYSSSSYNPAGWGENAAPSAKKRKVWDVALTVVLLVLGLFGAVYGVLTGIALTDPAPLEASLRSMYGGEPHLNPGPWPAVLMIANPLLYVVTVLLSILRLRAGRIAFWIPLVAGALSFVLFLVAALAIGFSDPAFFENLQPR